MFDTMKKLALATSVSVLALAGAVSAQDAVKVSKIDVAASYSAAQDSNAADVFPEIATDIQAAIAERVPTSSDAADPMVRVDIRKVALDGDTMMVPDSAEFNELEGVVDISSENGTLGDLSFPINIAAYTAERAVPEGYVAVAPSDTDFYNAMISGFADTVAERLANMNTGGDEVSK